MVWTLTAEKKTPFLVQLKQIFGPSFFVRALISHLNIPGGRRVNGNYLNEI
jgi:hypothetical protein